MSLGIIVWGSISMKIPFSHAEREWNLHCLKWKTRHATSSYIDGHSFTICIYIYIYRERETERAMQHLMHTYIYVYIYIHSCIYMYTERERETYSSWADKLYTLLNDAMPYDRHIRSHSFLNQWDWGTNCMFCRKLGMQPPLLVKPDM